MKKIKFSLKGALSFVANGILLFIAVVGDAGAWPLSHADGSNSSFVDVATIPAENPRVVPNIGTFAPGSGPVVANDGTVYLANKEGRLMSFQADGTRRWTWSMTSSRFNCGRTITASPVIDSRGAIYVIGSRAERMGSPWRTYYHSCLYKLNPAGELLWVTPFPNHLFGPTTTAPPNIWSYDGTEVLVSPVQYPAVGGYDTHLVAMSTDGAILDDKRVSSISYQVTGGIGDWCSSWLGELMCFIPSGEPVGDPATFLPEDLPVPDPGVAISSAPWTSRYCGWCRTPIIVASDQFHDLVGYSFIRGNGGGRFNEEFRRHKTNRWMRSSPMVMPDGLRLISVADSEGHGSILFDGLSQTREVPNIYTLAPPTRMADGRIAVVGTNFEMPILNGPAVVRRIALPGQSVVPAAASRTHLFVSTAGSFVTYDAATLERVAEIFWIGGGQVTPVIAPSGSVYAMASNVLFIFPPPRRPPLQIE